MQLSTVDNGGKHTLIRHKEEILPKRELKQLQLKRLKEVVLRGWKVPYYKTKMKNNGVTPEDIQTLDDLQKLPFMTKVHCENLPLFVF